MGDGLRVMVMAEDGAGRGGWGCSAGAAVNRLHRKPYQQKEESRERRDESREKIEDPGIKINFGTPRKRVPSEIVGG